MTTFCASSSTTRAASGMSIARIISIEGNIGSGKSTLLENLKEKYKDDNKMVFLDEPVKLWNNIKDKNGMTMLEKFYSDQDKYSFSFQMMAYISRLNVLRLAKKEAQNRKNKRSTEKTIVLPFVIFFDCKKAENI